jgi:hypothetical protein
VVAVPPKQRRKRVTTASRKNTTRDSSSVYGSDGDGILSVCGGHHVVTTGKAGTVKVKGKKSKVAGGGDRGGRSGGDTVAVLVKRRKRVAADSSSPTTSPATTSRPASSTTAATDASGRGRGRGRGRAGDSVSAGTAAFNNKKVRAAKKRMAELHVAATEALGIAVGRPWAVHENGPFSGVRGHLLTIMADPGRYRLNTQLVGSPPSVTPVPTRGFVLALHRHESVHVGRVVLQVVGVDRRKSSPCPYFAAGEFQQQVRLQLTDSTHFALGVITTELLSCGDVYNPGNLLEVTAWWSCPFTHVNGGRTSISMIISSAKFVGVAALPSGELASVHPHRSWGRESSAAALLGMSGERGEGVGGGGSGGDSGGGGGCGGAAGGAAGGSGGSSSAGVGAGGAVSDEEQKAQEEEEDEDEVEDEDDSDTTVLDAESLDRMTQHWLARAAGCIRTLKCFNRSSSSLKHQ